MAEWTTKATGLVQFFSMADATEFGGAEPFGGVAGETNGLIERLVSSDKVQLSMIPTGKGKLALCSVSDSWWHGPD